jgi:hypothetical protein
MKSVSPVATDVQDAVRPLSLQQVLGLSPSSLLIDLEPVLLHEYVWITEVLDHRPLRAGEHKYNSVKAIVVTGRLAGRERIFASIHLEAVSLEELIAKDELCQCNAIPYPHQRVTPGCRSQYSAPFCGNCGKSCKVEELCEPETMNGLNDRNYYTPVSICCECPELYSNASLTKEYNHEFIIL